MPPEVRAARPHDRDAVVRLLYLSAAGMYDRYAGDREAALRLLGRAFAREGTNASAEIVCVAEAGGRVAGALAGFPIREGARRGSAFLRLTLASLPPWRWPAALRLYRLGARVTPPAPPACFYVDGLATDPGLRRSGAARALLDAAEARARLLAQPALALDTALDNAPARALYESFGFSAAGEVAPSYGLPGFVGYVKRLA
ncbi:MAG: GNAT family N-acetyltransferase [Thermoleophilaceae bacterium]